MSYTPTLLIAMFFVGGACGYICPDIETCPNYCCPSLSGLNRVKCCDGGEFFILNLVGLVMSLLVLSFCCCCCCCCACFHRPVSDIDIFYTSLPAAPAYDGSAI